MKSLYTIYDSTSETYFSPQLFRNNGDALRTLSNEMENPESLLHKHPEDYTLIKLGSWDDLTGELVLVPSKEIISNLVELKKH